MEKPVTGTLSKNVGNAVSSESFSGTTVEQTFTQTCVVNWTKLEPGTAATGFFPKDAVEELAACQWFYETGDGVVIWSAKASDSGQQICPIFFSERKRVVPTVVLKDGNTGADLIANLQAGRNSISGWKINTGAAYLVSAYTFTADAEIYS